MKVLHVIPSLSPVRGGPSFAMRETAKGLAAWGITVHIATTDDDGPRHRRTPEGAEPLAGAQCFVFPRQTRVYSFSGPLQHWVGRHATEYDIIHTHALFSHAPVCAAFAARREGVPYCVRPLGTLSSWGLGFHRPALKQLSLLLAERPLLRDAALVQATSEQERREITAVCPEARIAVIPNPVDMPPANAPPHAAEFGTVLFLSRLDPKKGLEELLPAFDRAANNDSRLRLVIAGDGDRSYVESIRALAASLATGDRIVFVGNVNGEEKERLFSAASLFALPSRSENFGVAVVEAMARGVPVLLSPDVGIHEEVASAGAGRIASRTVDGLATALREMLASGDTLKQAGENGRRLARRYSREAATRMLVDEYSAILKRRAVE